MGYHTGRRGGTGKIYIHRKDRSVSTSFTWFVGFFLGSYQRAYLILFLFFFRFVFLVCKSCALVFLQCSSLGGKINLFSK